MGNVIEEKPFSVRDREPPSTVFLLSATTHPKGGEAWSVELRGGLRIGTLRRWSRVETSVRVSNTSASFSKRDVTKWTAYNPAGDVVRVEESRIAALRVLLAALLKETR